jgi:hypothetical protein
MQAALLDFGDTAHLDDPLKSHNYPWSLFFNGSSFPQRTPKLLLWASDYFVLISSCLLHSSLTSPWFQPWEALTILLSTVPVSHIPQNLWKDQVPATRAGSTPQGSPTVLPVALCRYPDCSVLKAKLTRVNILPPGDKALCHLCSTLIFSMF